MSLSIQTPGMPGYQSLETGDPNASDDVLLRNKRQPKFGFQIPVKVQIMLVVLFVSMLFVAGYISLMMVGLNNGCLGKPYLYLTHHNSHNILKFTRDGCALSANVLWYGTGSAPIPSGLRSIFIHPYNGIKDALYVANAGEESDDRSRILVFDTCSPINGLRSYLSTIVTSTHSSGVEHTYGLAFDEMNNMYASFQFPDAVFRFEIHNKTFLPSSAPYLRETFINDIYSSGDGPDSDLRRRPEVGENTYHRNYTSLVDYYKGTFVQFGWPGIHDKQTQGVRSVVWVPSKAAIIAKGSSSINNNNNNNNNNKQRHNQRFLQDDSSSSKSTEETNTVGDGNEPVNGGAEDAREGVVVGDVSHESSSPLSNMIDGVNDPSQSNQDKQKSSVNPTYDNPLEEGPGTLWIANENLHRVIIVDSLGRFVARVKIKNPIGLLYVPEKDWVFVGSKKSNKDTGAVYAVNVTSLEIMKKYTLLGGSTMDHPTGLAIYEDILYVAEQSMNVVLSFNVTSGRYIKQVIGKLNVDGIESLALSDC